MLDLDVRHLFEQSRIRLKELVLDRLSRSANKNKKHRAALADWVDELSTAKAMEWIAEHAEEIVLLASELTAEQKVPANEPKPTLVRPIPYEFWRTLERRARRQRVG